MSQFVYITDGGFSHDEIIKAERYMLSSLNFDLQYPNPLNFLRRCSKADNYDAQSRTVAKYLMEMSLINEYYLKVPPSLLAASALYLAREMLYGHASEEVWDANLEHYSGYAESDLKECVLQMCHDVENVAEGG